MIFQLWMFCVFCDSLVIYSFMNLGIRTPTLSWESADFSLLIAINVHDYLVPILKKI